MKLNVVHVSDIHFHSETDPIVSLADDIAAHCFYRAREADAVLIAVTGDVAFSGSPTQYEVAKSFFGQLTDKIKAETKKPVYTIYAPGNHDCVLKPQDDVRELVIDKIINFPQEANNINYINTCVSAQKNYFDFVGKNENPSPVEIHPLWREFEFAVAGQTVRVSAINVAWMSRLPEKAGTLVFPLDSFRQQLDRAADIRLVLLHQPYNWYQQSSYHHMRTDLRRASSAVLSGHEHVGIAGKNDDDLTGQSLYFESAALQPHEITATAGFATYMFDTVSSKVIVERYSIIDGALNASEDTSILDLPSIIENRTDFLDFKKEWRKDLSNPGANFIHPEKPELSLEDIFVYPDLRDWENEDPSKLKDISSEVLMKRISEGGSALILGDERAGKTTLLYVLAKKLREAGLYPVYVKASEINNIKEVSDVGLRINRFCEKQYQNHDLLSIQERQKKVLLIDDIDGIKSGIASIAHVLTYANNHFGSVVLTAAQTFEISSLASSAASEMLRSIPRYEMLRFGQRLRLRLIRKWCSLGQITSLEEFDKRVHQIEGIINTVIGRNLVPQLPIYLLILLQSSDQHQHGEIQNSGFSHYYQFLITKSLGQANVSANELNEYYNYLAHLTWFLHSKGSKELRIEEFTEFTTIFSKRFSFVESGDRLNKLLRARLLSQRGECYSFAYPFVYYFFLGKYLASRVHKDQEVKQWIEQACEKLYLRENANAILFLTHHENDPWVIEKVANVVRSCFPEIVPMHFNGDTIGINDLLEEVSSRVLISGEIADNQENARSKQDNLERAEDSLPDAKPDENGELEFVAKFTLLMKTAEILGQVLKNYYGSLEKPFKAELLKDVFDGPLRALGLQFAEIFKDIDGLVSYIEDTALKGHSDLDNEARKRLARRQAGNLFSWLGTSVVAASAGFVATDKLREDVSMVVSANPTIAYRLIEIGTRFVRPGSLPMAEIEKLVSDIKGNHFAFQILQSLAVTHLYLYHTDISQKNKLCSILKISIENVKKIEAKGRDLRLVSKKKIG